MRNTYTYLLAALLFILVPLIVAAERYDVPVDDSPSWGPAEAPITMIEFIDYQ